MRLRSESSGVGRVMMSQGPKALLVNRTADEQYRNQRALHTANAPSSRNAV